MTGTGYSKLKPCQTGLCATCLQYGSQNFEALEEWGDDLRSFCALPDIAAKYALPDSLCKDKFSARVKGVKLYLRGEFRRNCSAEAKCECVTHSLQHALSDPNPKGVFHVDPAGFGFDGWRWELEPQRCNHDDDGVAAVHGHPDH
jgi:hypothetical protein